MSEECGAPTSGACESSSEPNPRLALLRIIAGASYTDDHIWRNGANEYLRARRALTDEVLQKHLNGSPCVGVYPICPGSDQTQLAVLDFDDHAGSLAWDTMRDAAGRIIEEGRRHGLNALPVRSGGGWGVHLWYRWDAPQSAAAVRRLLQDVIAAEGFAEGTSGVAAGAVEIYPKQDHVEVNGLSNPIALPFARQSVPLAADLEPSDAVPLWSSSTPVAVTTDEPTPTQGSARPDTETVRAALRYVRGNDDHRQWIHVGLALKHSLGDEGRTLFEEWSAEGEPASYRGVEDVQKKWAKMRPNGHLTVGSIFHWAREGGWNGIGIRSFSCSDTGNAERLAAYEGPDLRYCWPWKTWLVWDGSRWRQDGDGEIFRRAKGVVLTIFDEAKNADTERAKQLGSWATRSLSKERRMAMVELARSELPVRVEDLDARPTLLNLRNGTLDLSTGELLPHDRAHLLTKIAGARFDPAATCPRWKAFLDRIMGGNDALIGFLQRAAGYALTTETGAQCFFLLHGSGANGKSTFLETLTALLGEYARPTDFRTLLARESTDAVRNDLAALFGLRMVTAVEVGKQKRLDEVVIKQLTGNDTITARFLFKELFDFRPTFKLFLAANEKPEIQGVDEAIWRRVLMVPFDVTIPVEERDPALLQKLSDELAGILNWSLAGLRQYRAAGLQPPDEVKEATQAYRDESDRLKGFLDTCCVIGGGTDFYVSAGVLYQRYDAWCQNNGADPVRQTTFGKMMGERGFRAKTGRRSGELARFYDGLRLLRAGETSKAEAQGGLDLSTSVDVDEDPDQGPPF